MQQKLQTPFINGAVEMSYKILLGMIFFLTSLNTLADNAAKPIAMLNDFEDSSRKILKPITYWQWSKEQLAQAESYSQLSIVTEGVAGGNCLQAVISPDLPWSKRDEYTLCSVSVAHFPPEADAIRMKIKVKSGTVRMRVGGPTIYFGSSDVASKTAVLDSTNKEWQEVTFSLNHDLVRNYRRAGFSTDAERIYYTRWAQEPCFLWILEGTQGEFLIDDIELVAYDEGKAFPVFQKKEINEVHTLVDFNRPDQMKSMKSLLMADNQVSAFALSWSREKNAHYLPPTQEIKKEDAAVYVHTQAEYREEIFCSLIRGQGSDKGNALRYQIRADKPGSNESVAAYDWNLSLEFIVFVGPPDFNWQRFGATDEMRKGPGPGFELNMSYKTLAGLQDVSFAMYHARRFVKMGEWSDVIIPFADFTCVYGQGEYRTHLTGHKDLVSGKDIIAVAILGTYPRAGRGKTSIDIQTITQVEVPGAFQDLRSFWQLPRPQDYKVHRDPGGAYGGMGTLLKK